MHNLDLIEFDLLFYNLVYWCHVFRGMLCYLARLKDFPGKCCWSFQQSGAQPEVFLCAHFLCQCVQFCERTVLLYQVLMTFLEGMLFLQWGYFDINCLLTTSIITADFDSCNHNLHWAFISSVLVITEAKFAFIVICRMMTMPTLFLWQF